MSHHVHYNPEYYDKHAAQISYRCLSFDLIMPDEVLRELMAPVVPLSIERKERSGLVAFEGTLGEEGEIIVKIRQWEGTEGRRLQAMADEEYRIESEARFQAYYESLNLDGFDWRDGFRGFLEEKVPNLKTRPDI